MKVTRECGMCFLDRDNALREHLKSPQHRDRLANAAGGKLVPSGSQAQAPCSSSNSCLCEQLISKQFCFHRRLWHGEWCIIQIPPPLPGPFHSVRVRETGWACLTQFGVAWDGASYQFIYTSYPRNEFYSPRV